ncbi:hypothetical protein [Phytoactinopolyspora halotolerans]|uniref:Adhesin domain-containing protein n=1 Tax=Phytoactinopolyspora halotolerans TaxID=1981512 RepID=A0A6L9S421_9ACTN|nr:hypothetical protein [Phytoactinopolyspora halotolerans]NED99796.1 hypothetical protein [Phytoactinopolyspora halotolerans]
MNDDDETREILEKVAAGELDPSAAAQLLEERASGQVAPYQAEPVEGRALPSMPEINRLLVRATSRRVRVIGDPSVSTVAIEGPHTIRRDGTTLMVTGETEFVPTDNAFTLLAGGRWREMADRVQAGFGQNLELRVRIRPDLPLGVEVIAGSLEVDGARAVDHVRMTAGSLRLRGAEAPIDLLMQAGSAQVDMVQTHGQSRLRCESGALQLTLGDGTDARVRSDVQLGRLSVVPEPKDRHRDVVVGLGAAEIDLEVVMGAVTLKTPDRGDMR